MHTLPTQAITSLRRTTGSAAQSVRRLEQADAPARFPFELPAALAPTGAEVFVSLFVSARLSLADHQLEEGDVDAAASCIAETHCLLLSYLCRQGGFDAWQQAALRHCRRTHCALLYHLQEFGSHAAIVDALRAGCLSLSIPSQRLQ
jgi:hypothetical protein